MMNTMTMRAGFPRAWMVVSALVAATGGCKFPEPPDVALVGGEVEGLWTGASITLRLAAGDVAEDLSVTTGEPFAFDRGLADGESYTVSVADDGPDHDCIVANGSGRIDGGDVLDLAVQCTNLIPHTLSISTPTAFSFDPRMTRYELPVSLLQHGVEVVVTGSTLTGAAVDGAPVAVGAPSPTVALGQGVTTVPVVVSKGDLSQRYELVFDRGAAPIVEATYAQASNAGQGDGFGTSVAAWGDHVAIGAPFEDSSTTAAADEGAMDSGAVYIFRRSGSAWMQAQILKGTAITAQRRFGNSVAMDRDVLVVGAGGDAARGERAGAVYVFRLEPGTGMWREEQRITASDAHAGDAFGASIAISGDRLVVGAIGHDRGGTSTDYGQLYVFARNGATWTEQGVIRDPASVISAGFGAAVAVSGDTVGARDFRANVRVFQRVGAMWMAESLPPTCVGAALDIEGSRLAVGQPDDASGTGQPGDQSAPSSGAIRVYSRTGAVWTEEAYLKAQVARPNARMGLAVAIERDTVATADTLHGALQVFRIVGGTWTPSPPVETSVPSVSFGFSAALTANGVVVGDLASGSNRGSAVIFR